jgi:hypothetical protein
MYNTGIASWASTLRNIFQLRRERERVGKHETYNIWVNKYVMEPVFWSFFRDGVLRNEQNTEVQKLCN